MERRVVPGCNNSGHHAIPKDNNRRCLWIKAMKLEGQILKPKFSSVCTLHFKDSDYIDADIDPLNMQRWYLKRHSVPSIFPWSEEPPTKRCALISEQEIIQSIMDSESQMENIETRDPLLKSTDDNDSISEIQSVEIPTLSSSYVEIECEKEFSFNASGVKNTYALQIADIPIQERISVFNKFVYNDKILVDKGLNVQDIFLSQGVKVNLPTFFKKGNRISPNTLTRDRKIASKS